MFSHTTQWRYERQKLKGNPVHEAPTLWDLGRVDRCSLIPTSRGCCQGLNPEDQGQQTCHWDKAFASYKRTMIKFKERYSTPSWFSKETDKMTYFSDTTYILKQIDC